MRTVAVTDKTKTPPDGDVLPDGLVEDAEEIITCAFGDDPCRWPNHAIGAHKTLTELLTDMWRERLALLAEIERLRGNGAQRAHGTQEAGGVRTWT